MEALGLAAIFSKCSFSVVKLLLNFEVDPSRRTNMNVPTKYRKNYQNIIAFSDSVRKLVSQMYHFRGEK